MGFRLHRAAAVVALAVGLVAGCGDDGGVPQSGGCSVDDDCASGEACTDGVCLPWEDPWCPSDTLGCTDACFLLGEAIGSCLTDANTAHGFVDSVCACKVDSCGGGCPEGNVCGFAADGSGVVNACAQ